ncbi:predicted protein [Histoplasma capsulatum H143]|uniref:Uncharacterized protein n=1 Tax=Ajellomyces capsulatus (strain H143) TaxID=544712 RepID=C6HQP7_AJECH|nr:predicted protein [Histoplasma capsulatum H143]
MGRTLTCEACASAGETRKPRGDPETAFDDPIGDKVVFGGVIESDDDQDFKSSNKKRAPSPLGKAVGRTPFGTVVFDCPEAERCRDPLLEYLSNLDAAIAYHRQFPANDRYPDTVVLFQNGRILKGVERACSAQPAANDASTLPTTLMRKIPENTPEPKHSSSAIYGWNKSRHRD